MAHAVSLDPSLCHDCGIDTTPCTGRRGCRHIGKWEHYMVHNALWRLAGEIAGFLCIGCLEHRLGRTLTPLAFPDFPINWPCKWGTPRLAARKIGTAPQGA